MTLLAHVQFDPRFNVSDDNCSSLKWTQNHFLLHHHLAMSLQVEETLLIVEENLRDLLLELGVPVSRWMFSVPDLLQQV